MQIVHAGGLAGARSARGLVVVIDVLRAFSVAAYALAAGARESILVTEVEAAFELQAQIPGAVISAEVGGLPVPGVEISNSPTAVAARQWQGLTLIQRSSAGTQGAAAAAAAADQVLAASLVVAAATAREIGGRNPPAVTLVAMGEESGHPEDRACALYLEGLLLRRPRPLAELLKPLFSSERYTRLKAGAWPGFPASDLELSLQADRFDFAMPLSEAAGRLVLRRS